MANAPRRRRARALRPRRRAPRQIPDSQQLAGIKQGVGRAVARAFGARTITRRRKRGGKRSMAYNCNCHDAFHMDHLPLPRPTGPYTVIRTTKVVTTNDALIMFGPIYDTNSGKWTTSCGYSFVDVAKRPQDNNNMQNWAFTTMNTGSWDAAQVTPAAFSVQCMNPNALQTTSGIVYGGRIRTAWKLSSNIDQFGNAISTQFISYNMPRLMAAAKLAFRGVQVDAVPFNMNRLADFTELVNKVDEKFTAQNITPDFAGFNPQFYYNPSKIPLQFLVCCEWRVRFDPSNPAQASHIQHTHADESIWMRALHTAEAAGNGVVDIAERVANTGQAIFNASYGAYRAARGVRALTSGMQTLALA